MSHKKWGGEVWGIVLAAGEGQRVRTFLSQLCGNRGIKQYCAVIGRRSLLDHTLTRVEQLVPRERILVIVSADHQPEVAQHLAHWPTENIIVQPYNRDTTAGILLPLAHVAKRDPRATVVLFPSDHFIEDESRFLDCVRAAVTETHWFPNSFVLLGMTPDQVEDGYGWIEPGSAEPPRLTQAVKQFWEKPSLADAHTLKQRGALWNSFVCVSQAHTIWEMVREAVPDVYMQFLRIYRALGTTDARHAIRKIYRYLRAVNFSSGVCQPWATTLRVLPVPDVGWSDLGCVDRILATAERLGKKDELMSRLTRSHHKATPVLLNA
jgi:mannose-1-phosphate guanylyltransferase